MKRAIILSTLILLFLTLTSTLAHAQVVGFISKLQGRVDILKEGAPSALPVRVNDPVSIGDIVRTKSDGKAELTFKDGTVVRVAPKSRLRIDEYLFDVDNTRKEGRLYLFRGKLRAIVSKTRAVIPVAAGVSTFNVNTPTAVAGVRGTDFFVFYDKGITGVIFKEGSGFVVNPNMPDKIVNVNAGQVTFVVTPDAPPLAPRRAPNVEMVSHIKDITVSEKPKEKEIKITEVASIGGIIGMGEFGEGGEVFGFTPPIGITTDAIPATTTLLPVTETQPQTLNTDVTINVIFK